MKPLRMTMSDGSLHVEYKPRIFTRPNYSMHHRNISSTHDMRATLRAGKYTSLGSYPLYLVTSDGGALCFGCAREEYRQISNAIKHNLKDGWRVVACDINEENHDLTCDHCNKQVEAAYGEPDKEVEDEEDDDSTEMISAQDIEEFNSYLQQCTPAQVRGVFENESAAKRAAYVTLARAEANRRNVALD